jgi:hypothetical protein
LATAPGFEEALRARVADLAGFTHPSFQRVCAVEYLDGGGAERPPIRMRMHPHDALVTASPRS